MDGASRLTSNGTSHGPRAAYVRRRLGALLVVTQVLARLLSKRMA